MKILSIAIPCYNSAAYMENCIHSLMGEADDLEIIIVDDGSKKDNTAQIADEYAAKYPSVIKAVHQENGGHGEAVNTGLRNATGVYYKVIDSDDWADPQALHQVVARMKELEEKGTGVDLFLANFIYDKVGASHKKTMEFRNAFPVDQVFEWNQIGHMRQTQYILMHNIFYRRSVLAESGLVLPSHTFYVDNIFAFQPYPYVRKLYYMDVDLYHYYIGREDQSVNEKIMIGRIDQQIKVNKIMIDIMAEQDFSDKDPQLERIMFIYLDKIMGVTSALLLVDGSEEALKKKAQVWEYLREKDEKLYRRLRSTLVGRVLNLPGVLGRKVSLAGYKFAQKLVGFN